MSSIVGTKTCVFESEGVPAEGYGSWLEYYSRLREVERPLFDAYCVGHPRVWFCRDYDCGLAWLFWFERHGSISSGNPAWSPRDGARVMFGPEVLSRLDEQADTVVSS